MKARWIWLFPLLISAVMFFRAWWAAGHESGLSASALTISVLDAAIVSIAAFGVTFALWVAVRER
ncbi:hypothetical protein [Rhodocyclus gracilis]|uniref:Uncharacterized protein n=1 Tax=Rhodocyclus tenuis TaxID=1066 RepID=A0A6L5JU78_RHOTE|nr:hypothetical protein [Rhodocyclus gracilis]MQY50779.1 hypothetical protein [Rhodocyclus gracilis]